MASASASSDDAEDAEHCPGGHDQANRDDRPGQAAGPAGATAIVGEHARAAVGLVDWTASLRGGSVGRCLGHDDVSKNG